MSNIRLKKVSAFIFILLLVVIDQIIKVAVKTNMTYGENITITNWFHFVFIENSGIAFGLKILPGFLQILFRIGFVSILIWYLNYCINVKFKYSYVLTVSLIISGAIGNIFDAIFYGEFFSNSTFYNVSSIVSSGSGYSGWFQGKVVDMFYFPLFNFDWPNWIPFIGGQNFVFFSPVFNFADATITCGVILLFLFFYKTMAKSFRMVSIYITKKKQYFIARHGKL